MTFQANLMSNTQSISHKYTNKWYGAALEDTLRCHFEEVLLLFRHKISSLFSPHILSSPSLHQHWQSESRRLAHCRRTCKKKPRVKLKKYSSRLCWLISQGDTTPLGWEFGCGCPRRSTKNNQCPLTTWLMLADWWNGSHQAYLRKYCRLCHLKCQSRHV